MEIITRTEKLNNHIKIKRKHDNLTDLCHDLLLAFGHQPQKHIEYSHGELDILCDDIYLEVKCNYTHRNVAKAINQIDRAIRFKQAKHGYLLTYQGLYNILD